MSSESRAEVSVRLGRYCCRVEVRREIRWVGKVWRIEGRVRKGGGGDVAGAGVEVFELALLLALLLALALVFSEADGKMFLYMETVAKDCSRKISM